jgi:hypothetical protein
LAENRGSEPAQRAIREVPPRQGWVWPAIRRVLATADEPLPPVAIYAAVVEDLDTQISKSTIKNELRRRLTTTPSELAQNRAGGYVLIRAVPGAARATV